MWFDSHCHLNDEAFDADFQEVFEEAIAAGVEGMIVVGYDLKSSYRAVELASAHRSIWAAVGIHPHDAKTWDHSTLREIESLLREPKVVALGEIGLDYHYNYSEKPDQLKAFREQMLLAKELQKPVIIHNREAHGDTLAMLTETPISAAGGVMHCFTGSREVAVACLNQGLYISFAGSLTFRNAHKLAETALGIPLDKMLIETDSPYLTPHPFRGERNKPSMVKLVGQKLAEIKNLSVADIMKATSVNCRSLFKI